MEQLASCLSLSPQQLKQLVQHNLNNDSLKPLIIGEQLLKKIQLQLTRVEYVEFFVKNVFKIIREPTKNEMSVLKEYMKSSEDENVKSLVWLLLEVKQKQNYQITLAVIKEQLLKGGNLNVRQFLKESIDPKCKACNQLLLLLLSNHQNGQWQSLEFRNKLLTMTTKCLQQLEKLKQDSQVFIEVFALLLKLSIKEQAQLVWLTLFLRKVLQIDKTHGIIIIKYIHTLQDKDAIPNSFMSRGIFTMFASVFEAEVYFDQNLESQLEPILRLSKELFECLSGEIGSIELGWLSIFSLDRLIQKQSFEKDLHICSSILREVWYDKSQLLSQCFCSVIAAFIQKTSVADNIQYLESILTILTPKQLKYLILKLNTILSESKKGQLVEAGIKINRKALESCIYHFLICNSSSSNVNILNDFKAKLKEEHFDLQRQFEISSYSTYEKQLQHFQASFKYCINNNISGSDLSFKCKLLPKLRFYKDLFMKDYFSEQYWITEEKMIIFGSASSGQESQIQVVNHFFEESKIINLSGLMLLTEILKSTKSIADQNQLYDSAIKRFSNLIIQTLTKDNFTSSLILVLDFLYQASRLEINNEILDVFVSSLRSENVKTFLTIKGFTRIHFYVEFIIFKRLESKGQLDRLQQSKQFLRFYQNVILEGQAMPKNDQSVQTISELYLKYPSICTSKHFTFRQIKSKKQMKTKICSGLNLQSIQPDLSSVTDQFRFESPTYKEEIVYLTYIAHSPQDNYYFRNHYVSLLQLEYVVILSKTLQKSGDKVLLSEVYEAVVTLLERVHKGDTFSHTASFYKSLLQSRIVYILCSCKNVSYLDVHQLSRIFELCLTVIQKDNYPLLRQYIETVLCRTYLELNIKDPLAGRRKQLIDRIQVSVNIGVPILLTLGYELISFCHYPQHFKQQGQHKIHQLLVKFISCHTAYLRAICQYYLNLYLELVPPSDPFLLSISKYWKQDKDSQKILKNVAIVVDGFREGVEKQMDFLGFERVEEYPSNRVKLEFYRSISIFYSEQVLGELMINEEVPLELLTAYSQAVQQRAKEMKTKYLQNLLHFSMRTSDRSAKGNSRPKETNQKVQANDTKDKTSKGKKGNNKLQKQQIDIVNNNNYAIEYIAQLENKYADNLQIKKLSNWYRIDPSPTVIVIATLLQKVHNFGHILRTLNGLNAMVVVPSQMPLQHAECKELVPSICDVPIVQIKQKDLGKFITLMKSQGYPMVALEQCSRSVQLEESKFPGKFMLLLGNERLGAPSWLLNEGDILVEIPQIGKIRSLNVHVSMVLCFWEYLSKMAQ